MRKLIEKILAVIGILGLLCAAVFIFVMPNVAVIGLITAVLSSISLTFLWISE